MITRTIAGLLWQPMESPSTYELVGSQGAVCLVFDNSEGPAEWLLVLNRENDPIIPFLTIADAAQYFACMVEQVRAGQ